MTKRTWRPRLSIEEKERMNEDLSAIDPMGHFDREGELMSIGDWAEAFEDFDYKVVAKDRIGDYEVSTVWLGLDHRFGDPALLPGKPIIFETMVFDNSPKGLKEVEDNAEEVGMPREVDLGPDRYCERYATEEEALVGHKQAVAAVEAGLIGAE